MIERPELDSGENCIEWMNGDRKAVLTISHPKTIKRLTELARTKAECKVEVNDDGSIYATIPITWIKINPKRELTGEAKETARIRAKRNLKPLYTSAVRKNKGNSKTKKQKV